MKGKDKNKELRLSRFLRYREGKMTGEERNSFERELQKDPFAAEAEEGFELVTGMDIENDLQQIEKRIRKRAGRRTGKMIYRIAATVTVLMIISSIFIFTDRKKAPEQLAMSEPVVLEIEKPEPVKESMEEEVTIKEEDVITEDVIIKEERQVHQKPGLSEVSPISETGKQQREDGPEKAAADIPGKPGLALNETIVADELAAPAAARRSLKKAAADTATGSRASGTVTSAEDNLPIPGASVAIKGTTYGVVTDSNGNFSIDIPDRGNVTLVASFIGMRTVEVNVSPDSSIPVVMTPDNAALSEVVVVGYGTAGKEDGNVSSSYSPPRPADGKDSFDRYITGNIRRPDPATAGQRVVVVAGFRVRKDGTLDSIRIIRSPDKSFSDEAVRLIREGPAWLPAKRDGSAIDDNVRVRIVFK